MFVGVGKRDSIQAFIGLDGILGSFGVCMKVHPERNMRHILASIVLPWFKCFAFVFVNIDRLIKDGNQEAV